MYFVSAATHTGPTCWICLRPLSDQSVIITKKSVWIKHSQLKHTFFQQFISRTLIPHFFFFEHYSIHAGADLVGDAPDMPKMSRLKILLTSHPSKIHKGGIIHKGGDADGKLRFLLILLSQKCIPPIKEQVFQWALSHPPVKCVI